MTCYARDKCSSLLDYIITDSVDKKASIFLTSLVFADKAGAYPSGTPCGFQHNGIDYYPLSKYSDKFLRKKTL
jgi:hypothetical protein